MAINFNHQTNTITAASGAPAPILGTPAVQVNGASPGVYSGYSVGGFTKAGDPAFVRGDGFVEPFVSFATEALGTITTPGGGVTGSYSAAAFSPDYYRVLAAIDANWVWGTPDPVNNTVTWSTLNNPYSVGGQAIMLYYEQRKMFVLIYGDSFNSGALTARTIQITGWNAAYTAPTLTAGSALVISTSSNFNNVNLFDAAYIETDLQSRIGVIYKNQTSGGVEMVGLYVSASGAVSISSSATTVIPSSDSPTSPAVCSILTPASNGAYKFGVAYSNSNGAYAMVVDASSLSVTNAATLVATAGAATTRIAYESTEDRLVVMYANKLIAADYTQTPITYGSAVTTTLDSITTSVLYDPTSDKIFAVSASSTGIGDVKLCALTLSNLTLAVDATNTVRSPQAKMPTLIMAVNPLVVYQNQSASYLEARPYKPNRGSNISRFSGFIQASTANGQTATVSTTGAVVDNVGVVRPLTQYYLSTNALLTTSSTAYPVGKAVSPYSILLSLS